MQPSDGSDTGVERKPASAGVAQGRLPPVVDDSGRGLLAFIGAMVPEVRPIVKRLGLTRVGAGDLPADLTDLHLHRGATAGREVLVAVTSMGTAAATSATTRLLDAFPVTHVAAVGVCGGISPEVAIGDLITPAQVLDEASGKAVLPTTMPGHVARGTLMTTDVLHNEPGELAGFVERGIVAVDMETASIGAVCHGRGVPWSVFRAVSDRAGDPAVDEHVLGLSHADGTAAPAAVARFLLTRPHRIPTLVKLGRGLNAAVTTSTRAAMAAHGI
jgi:adenosylhomocysteine nucleosidase